MPKSNYKIVKVFIAPGTWRIPMIMRMMTEPQKQISNGSTYLTASLARSSGSKWFDYYRLIGGS